MRLILFSSSGSNFGSELIFYMWKRIKKYIKQLFEYPEAFDTIPDKTLETVDLLDDVWIADESGIRRAWIWEISKNTITIVTYDSAEEIKIKYKRPLNKNVIQDGNIALYLNKPAY